MIVPLLLAASACSGQDDPVAVATPSTAASSSAAAAAPSASPPAAAAAPVLLFGDGIDTGDMVLTFSDTSYDTARPALDAAFGKPTTDSGEVANTGAYGVCPEKRQHVLEYGAGAVQVRFGDVPGPGVSLLAWRLSRGSTDTAAKVRLLVGDQATYEFGPGSTLGDLRAGAGEALEVSDEEPIGASFKIQDQSSGLYGTLTGTTDADTVEYVQGGGSCGE